VITSVPGRFDSLRAVRRADEPFLFDVFCTMLADEVAAMPDPRLVRHFLRIQHTAQETRFATRFPGHVSVRVPRRNVRASSFYASLGFRLVTMDDLDHYYEWTP
jgi:hypothetical protein